MKIAKRAAALIALLAISFFAVGYGSAWTRLEQCRSVAIHEVLSRHVTGRGLGGEPIVLTAQDVSARVSGPFQVETQYMVPFDMHGTMHLQQFTVFPWAIKPGKRQAIQLV